MEKPYAVFAYMDYYPCGGWGDLFERFKTLEEAREAIAEHEKPGGVLRTRYDNYAQDWGGHLEEVRS